MDRINYSVVIENDYELDFYKNLRIKILNYLSKSSKATFYEILLHCGGSDRRTLRLLNQMVINKEIQVNNQKIYPLKPKKLWVEKSFSKAVQKYKVILNRINFKPTFLFDQRPINYKSKVSRIKRIFQDPDAYKIGKIAFLGDDDFTSILASLVFLDKKIYVFEIDPRIIKILNIVVSKEKLSNLIVVRQDLLKPINSKFKSKFDLFIMDPSPEPTAFNLFLKKAKFLLKRNGIGYLCFYPSHTQIFIDFQKILTNLKFVIIEMLPEYTEYAWVKETYSNSDLKLLDKYSFPKNSIINFVENLTKVKSLGQNEYYKLKQKSKMPKATERILKDPSKDPSFIELLTDNELYDLYKKKRNIQ